MTKKNLNHETLLKLVKVSSLIDNLASEFFSKYQTSDLEFNILVTLDRDSQELSQSDLAKKLIIKKSNLVTIIDKLEKKKLLQRKKDPKDRRINTLVLTEAGQNFIAEIEPFYFKQVDKLINQLEEKEKEALTKMMEKLAFYLENQI